MTSSPRALLEASSWAAAVAVAVAAAVAVAVAVAESAAVADSANPQRNRWGYDFDSA